MSHPETRNHSSIPEIAQQLSEREPSARIVGSLGRHSIMGVNLPEFRDNGTRRDIDYFTLTPGNKLEVEEHEIGGVRLDRDFNDWIRTESNGTYLVFPSNESLNVEVKHPEEVFSPYAVMHEDAAITTLRPEVLGKLHHLKGTPRPKDRVSATAYDAYLAAHPPKGQLPDELLEPFDEFTRTLNSRTSYRLRGMLRNGYYRLAPEQLRKKVKISRFF